MYFDVSEGGERMAGSTVVSNPTGVVCRLRGSGTNSTPLNSKRASRTATGGNSSQGGAASGTGSESQGSGSKASITGTPASGPLRPPKPCCFCWCCCCSCSCLAVKSLEENGPTKNSNNSDSFICDVNEAPPTVDEIRNWGNSFDKLMKSAGGRKVFRDFLRCEYSEENILFWLACEELKRETDPDVIEEKARKIYEDFISILSPKEVSLDSRVREIVNRNMVEPTPHTFDEAQLQIYTLMHRDSYPRFVNSSIFKNLAKMNNFGTSDAESSAGVSQAGSTTIAQQPTKQSSDSNG